jgi:hypothetical protein
MLFADYSVLESQNKLLLENNFRLDLAHKKQREKRRSYKKAYKDQLKGGNVGGKGSNRG